MANVHIRGVPDDVHRLLKSQAALAGQSLRNARLIRYPHPPLRDRVWEVRAVLTAYDATYLALAEALEDPVLLTADAGLAARGLASLGEERVRHVA